MAGIKTIPYTAALEAVLWHLYYTEARLLKAKRAKDLAAGLAPLIARYDGVRAGQLAAWRAEVIAQAGVDDADDTLDDTVGDAGDELLRVVKKDPKHPRVKRYLTGALSDVIRLGLASEVERVRLWPASLKTEPEAALKDLGARLEVDVAAGDAALAERATAAANTADHRVRQIVAWIDDVNAARLSLYGTLIKRVQKYNLPRDWPERFFRRDSGKPRARRSADSATPPATSPTSG